MALIRVTAEELKNRAEMLNEANANLKAKIQEFEAASQALAAQWEGEAKDAFVNAYTQDKAQMDNFSNVITDYYQKLSYIAQNYDAAERKNTDIATTRNYG
ncbi:MAG: WXG100 family type VII secretion target [Lachnospiraceae bacterium]|nr:WXG100 family type VII secretion target [Lachnospiraceae bacterium]